MGFIAMGLLAMGFIAVAMGLVGNLRGGGHLRYAWA
jgi:hypothetical protein